MNILKFSLTIFHQHMYLDCAMLYMTKKTPANTFLNLTAGKRAQDKTSWTRGNCVFSEEI